MPWIPPADRLHFEQYGYMVIRGVLAPGLIADAVRDIAAYVRADLDNPQTWYNMPRELDGVVPLHHAQSLWNIRQDPSLYQLFSEFFGTHRLGVDINRCIFRPPVSAAHPWVSHSDIHWDTDPLGPAEPSVQTGILLTPIKPNAGGFQCIPEIYRHLGSWLDQNARGRAHFDFQRPCLNSHRGIVQVTADAGDVILWSTQLPHGSASNLSKRPRIATFVTMCPPEDSPELRAEMRDLWLSKRAPVYWRGLPAQQDPEPGEPAKLTPLGRQLIGLDPWS
ncbi:phytanoyl-CoA dioxygenase [Bryobacterales bacterium F-183]|nr:phytanoyl-CoA dioxygenase [Bryobacterales bacterium F-183]